MTWRRLLRGLTIQIGLGLMLGTLLSSIAPAQEELASPIRRYKEREASTGYYEEYEVKPRHLRPRVGFPHVARPPFTYSPKAAEVRIRTRLADSHRGIQFYVDKRCDECHVEEAKDIHTTRGNLTCRQCHGGEPIASIEHYYSLLNPIRRHSYVCSKCHEGANISFATYVVHEPKAGAAETRKTFPALYYANWFMLLLLVGVFAFFIPHSVIWVVRDFLHKKGKPEDEPRE